MTFVDLGSVKTEFNYGDKKMCVKYLRGDIRDFDLNMSSH